MPDGSQHLCEPFENSVLFQVPEFAGIKKGAIAILAALVLDVKLVLVDHLHHTLMIVRTLTKLLQDKKEIQN